MNSYKFIVTEKIRVGISACTMGAHVRWNAKGWDKLAPLGRERDAFIWTPVCPEVASGLGVPRPTIRLSGGNGTDFWEGKAKMKNRRGFDVSSAMKDGMNDSLAILKRSAVEAFVFMEGSPTCGVYRTTLKNKRLGQPPGAFGALLLEQQLFLIPAADLESPIKWWDWRRRLHAFVWLQRAEILTKSDVYTIWHQYKFLCQEIDRKKADSIGRQIAEIKGKLSNSQIEEWRNNVLLLLRQPSTYARIQSSIQKHYAFFKKHLPTKKMPVLPFDSFLNKHEFVDRLHQLEQEAYSRNIEFTAVPVLYREIKR